MKSIGLYPRVCSDTAGTAIVSHAGAVGLVETVRVAGLDRAFSQALEPWRKPNARHDPGKILVDLALSLAVGGDCLADVALLRDQPGVFGPVASDPTVSRLVDTLAADAGRLADHGRNPPSAPRHRRPVGLRPARRTRTTPRPTDLTPAHPPRQPQHHRPARGPGDHRASAGLLSHP